MIYTTQVTVSADTSTNKLVLTLPDGRRIALTFSPKRQEYVYIVVNDVPHPAVDKPKDLVRWLVQKLMPKDEVARQYKAHSGASNG
jgi:hypothetical protein